MKPSPIPPAGVTVTGAALREAAAQEINDVISLVTAALRAKLAPDQYPYVDAIYPDRVIVRVDSRQFAYPYTLGDDNVVSLGEATEVIRQHTPVAPLREAAAGGAGGVEGWFVEALPADAEKPPRYLVRVIRAGLSKNGVNYSAKVLREAAPLFDGVRVFVKGDQEHIKGGGKDFRQLIGKLSQPRFVEAGKDGGEIQAVMDVLESVDVSAQLREAVERDMTELFGLSIDAAGTSKPNGKFREATKINRVASVDLIIEPGAGGQIIRFAEAHQEPDMLRQQMLDLIRGRDASRAAALENASDQDVLTAYREAVAAEQAGNTQTGVGAEDVALAIRTSEARGAARLAVVGSTLPQAAKDRLIQRFAEAKVDDLTDEKVQAAIKAEGDYGNSFRESAPVSGLGSFSVEGGETRAEKVGLMLDDFFANKKGNIGSFREAYIEITGDVRLTGRFADCDHSRLAEAAGCFREAVSAATFADILGNSITRAMVRDYNANPLYADFRDLVDIVPVRDFRTQERTRMGGYGNLPAVAENGSYDPLATPNDEKATYALSKRGGTETISIETIANDDVGLIRRIPQRLSTAAGRTLYEFVLGFLGTNPVIYDTTALFVAGHNNLGTAALDATAFAAARLRMQKQAEADSAKRLGLILSHLYVPVDLEEAAFDLFVRNTNNDDTFVQSRKPKVHVVPHWTDANNWYATADKSQIPLIELGFFNGQEEPELFVQDNPTQGSLFTNDQIKYKIRHIYSGAVVDFRGFDGSIVA